jgi:hypothetical protein
VRLALAEPTRRGRCLADTDLMINLPFPLFGSGAFA